MIKDETLTKTCSKTPKIAKANHPKTTNPQWSEAAKISSMNQKVWPHSLRPTLGRIMNGPATNIK